MSTLLAQLPPEAGFLKTAGFVDDLPPLDGLPWLAPSGSVSDALTDQTGPMPTARLPRAAIAAAVAVLFGGAWLLAEGTQSQPAPAMAQAASQRGDMTPLPYAMARKQAAGQDAGLAPAETPERTGPLARPAPVKPVALAPMALRTPPPAAAAAPPPASAQPLVPAPAAGVAVPAAPVADSPASAATLGELDATMDLCRAAIRAVIRLGDRQRPGRSATAEEQVGYRLRQQNAEAAKGYRSYIATLARSVRGLKSEDAARQSLDKARQTLAYLDTMLADSQASLR
jgi:hypothetical protein